MEKRKRDVVLALALALELVAPESSSRGVGTGRRTEKASAEYALSLWYVIWLAAQKRPNASTFFVLVDVTIDVDADFDVDVDVDVNFDVDFDVDFDAPRFLSLLLLLFLVAKTEADKRRTLSQSTPSSSSLSR